MKIFLCEPIHKDAFDLLNNKFEIINNMDDIHQCEVIISRNLKIDSSFIDQCSCLKLIVIHGSGYDDVDTEYLKSKGIHLCNTPGYNALSVAELIVAMMLNLSRKISLLQHDHLQNKLNGVALSEYSGFELSYKTMGIIGVGDIALKTISILKDAFHMKVIAYSRSLTPDRAKQLGIQHCESMSDVFKEADYISINVDLNKETYHFINKDLFSLMKPTAFLINTSRGAVINEDDLYLALKENWFAGAGIDVLENEPVPYDYPLLQLQNVVYTPHMGATTDEALKRVGDAIVDVIEKYTHHELCEHFLF